MIRKIAVLAIAAASLSPASLFAADLTTFTSDLCYQVARNGDENGTDSADAYGTICTQDLAREGLTSAKAVTRRICLKAADYSADLHETVDDTKSAAQLKALKNQLIKKCFSDAASIAAQNGLDL